MGCRGKLQRPVGGTSTGSSSHGDRILHAVPVCTNTPPLHEHAALPAAVTGTQSRSGRGRREFPVSSGLGGSVPTSCFGGIERRGRVRFRLGNPPSVFSPFCLLASPTTRCDPSVRIGGTDPTPPVARGTGIVIGAFVLTRRPGEPYRFVRDSVSMPGTLKAKTVTSNTPNSARRATARPTASTRFDRSDSSPISSSDESRSRIPGRASERRRVGRDGVPHSSRRRERTRPARGRTRRADRSWRVTATTSADPRQESTVSSGTGVQFRRRVRDECRLCGLADPAAVDGGVDISIVGLDGHDRRRRAHEEPSTRDQDRSTSVAGGFDPYSAGTQFWLSIAGRS